MISYEETETICEALEIEIETSDGVYHATTDDIQEYLKEAIAHYGEKLYEAFHKKATTADLPFPLLCYSNVLEEWFTFEFDGKEITQIEFASGVVYKPETLEGFLTLPAEDKRKFYWTLSIPF